MPSETRRVSCPKCKHPIYLPLARFDQLEDKILAVLRASEFALPKKDINTALPEYSIHSISNRLKMMLKDELVAQPKHGYWSA